MLPKGCFALDSSTGPTEPSQYLAFRKGSEVKSRAQRWTVWGPCGSHGSSLAPSFSNCARGLNRMMHSEGPCLLTHSRVVFPKALRVGDAVWVRYRCAGETPLLPGAPIRVQ